ncbi:MAG: SDR family NAD(P)-dependent oxidoreductase, partial [Mesorhizobium sp.]
MSELFSLNGRVALVTGASRGLGFAMAKALVENGATVIVNARDPAALSAAAERIGAEALPFDVTDAAISRASLEGIVERHGRLDILVNNAGIQHRSQLVEWQDEDFNHVIAVNLSACFRMMRDAVRLMLPNKFGRIINTGSIAAILGRPTIHAYVAAKAGLHGLTRSTAAELGRHGITVNAIAPGY